MSQEDILPPPPGPQDISVLLGQQANFSVTVTDPPTVAQILVGPLTPDDQLGLFVAPDDSQQIFEDYLCINRYEYDYHRYMGGLTIPGSFFGASVAFIQLSTPTVIWICDWTACRWKEPPTIPDPASADTSWILLDVLPEPAMVVVGSDGVTPLYRISGTYVYGNLNPNSASPFQQAVYPVAPWIKPDPSIDRIQPTGDISQGISDIV